MKQKEKANLEMTLADHEKCGSTPPKELRDNPGKMVVETMDAAALLAFMQSEVAHVAQMHKKAKELGDERTKEFLILMRDGFLGPNVAFLRRIGRLPAEFADLDPARKFAL